MYVIHPFEPIYDKDSKVLILGSIPSVKSREVGFYYGHPRNRFWKTLEKVYGEEIGLLKQQKIDFLKRHQIALFDVLKACEITSSKDSSIKNPFPNDFSSILEKAKIQAIFTTGRKAYQLYYKYCFPKTKLEAKLLPSPSPLNCRKGIEQQLVSTYSQIREITDSC